jgi:L-asparagine oxygenase
MGITIYRNTQIGDIPPTPSAPLLDEDVVPDAKESLLWTGRALGFPVGYKQEQGGRLIHNIFPVKTTEDRQISTSSKVELEMHTETSFHPYRPSFVLLLCLRGDPAAATTYANDFEILSRVGEQAKKILQQNWFTTSIDESFRTNGEEDMDIFTPVLRKVGKDGWQLTYDSFFMKAVGDGSDASLRQAEAALQEFKNAVISSTREVVLKAGDLLVINNENTIHGRKPFQPRYDGTDRWVQRLLVVKRLPSAPHISGSVITTEFRRKQPV